MSVLLAEARTRVPLALTIDQEGVGGISGLVPTVAIRRGTTAGSYLDWDDNSFKTSGWATKYAPLTESERGNYERLLDLALVPGAPAGTVLVAEYHVDNGGDVKGDDHDLLFVVSTQTDLTLVRKLLVNKLVETPGSPGVLVIYDDDGVTPLKQWELQDYTGGATMGTQGAPSRRLPT